MQRADLKSVEERKATLLNSLRKDGFNYSVRLLNGLGCSSHTDMELQARRRDHVSHYILRLAYCQNMELRRWFVNMEVEYLKLRFSSLNKEGILKLMALNDFDYTPVSRKLSKIMHKLKFSQNYRFPKKKRTMFERVFTLRPRK